MFDLILIIIDYTVIQYTVIQYNILKYIRKVDDPQKSKKINES